MDTSWKRKQARPVPAKTVNFKSATYKIISRDILTSVTKSNTTTRRMTKCITLGYIKRVIVAQGSFCLCVVRFNDALSGQNIIVSNGRMNMIGYRRKLRNQLGTVPEFSCGDWGKP